MMFRQMAEKFHILSLDGGGAKGFYTLGILRELEAQLQKPLHKVFQLIYGTSTGSIIASLLALGKGVDEIIALYEAHVLSVVRPLMKANKTAALEQLGKAVFGATTFADFRTDVGIVCAKWQIETPMIFKSNKAQAHGLMATFEPGFGALVRDAVVASCSAYPFFDRKNVQTSQGDSVELIDGGYCANNPALYAMSDAIGPFGIDPSDIRILSLGCGNYPEPKRGLLSPAKYLNYLVSVRLLQKTLEINTNSMDQLRTLLFPNVQSLRISATYSTPEMATDLFESDLTKLNLLRQRGRHSFGEHETDILELMKDAR